MGEGGKTIVRTDTSNNGFIKLGQSDILISPMGVGTWAWGDNLIWGYGKGDYTDADLRDAFKISLEAGINFFDTAEVYGFGRSEKILGGFLKTEVVSKEKPIIVATKFFPFPFRLNRQCLQKALRRSLIRLELNSVDLYQVHWPLPPIPIETWMEGLAQAISLGLTRTAGVSNFNPQQMRRAHTALAQRGIQMVSNQVKYSLLDRQVERNGLMALCQELGVTLIAYSPLEMGMLTGKYTPSNRPTGNRRHRYSSTYLEQIQPLINLMREIGQSYAGKTPAQVALNWTICKGTVPIPGAKNKRQAQENIGALGWQLTKQDLISIEEAAEKISK
jgi:aryl-alcohol dehydrogenase-like predicted oxidoreductase